MTDPTYQRILVTGSRKWTNPDTITATLDNIPVDPANPPVLVHGAAEGADTIAAEHWKSLGYPTEPHPANWRRYGRKRAGHIRNAQMVNLDADLCLAFIHNHSAGTTHTVELAEAAGIPLRIHRENT